ncbi:hypothetical protein [Sphingomonas sp. GB1N7]|uniref:hypothetical protein n=1 Tax=Parasphingomonas caseinilytica TaxID=3096158 RepID=UPI002FC89369
MMLTALLLALMADTPVSGLPIDVLPKQALPAKGCAAYLFIKGETPVFVAMASADPAQLRVSIGGALTDVARTGQTGGGGYGFAGVTEYAGGGVTAVLDMKIEARADLKDGAAVRDATLRIDKTGQDSVVVAVAGIIGCAKS